MPLRREDWPARLNEAIAARLRVRFAFGAHDCCLFAADVVQAMTGLDPAARFRDRYRTAHGAARVLKRAGGLEPLMEQIAAAHGMPEVPPLTAQRGDVVLLDAEPDTVNPALGVVAPDGRIAAAGPDWLAFLPLRAARRAWRV